VEAAEQSCNIAEPVSVILARGCRGEESRSFALNRYMRYQTYKAGPEERPEPGLKMSK
jgi:hypothetical protein